MEFRKFGSMYVVRINKGEDVIETLKKFAADNGIKLGSITGIGASNQVTLGLFDTSSKKYIPHEYKGDFEIASLTGNISTMNGETYLHVHACIADENNRTYGGHLSRAVISATGEIFINAAEGEVDRELDSDTGINLIRFK